MIAAVAATVSGGMLRSSMIGANNRPPPNPIMDANTPAKKAKIGYLHRGKKKKKKKRERERDEHHAQQA